LSEARAELAAQGVQYVFADDNANGTGHQQFAKSFIANPPSVMVRAVATEKVRKDVFDEISAAQAPSILLSSENFPLADLPALVAFFGALPRAFSVKIVLFARSQDELAESQYNQLVKLKREMRPFAEFAHGELGDCDFFEEAIKWERHFGRDNVICHIYDAKSDAVEQFLRCIPCIRPELLSATLRSRRFRDNSSIGMKALVVARILSSVELNNREKLYAEIFAKLSKDDLPALLIDSRQARELRSRFAESNRAFTRRFLGDPTDDLGGRRYSDDDRDRIRAAIAQVELLRF
jgi:hypothetical protein